MKKLSKKFIAFCMVFLLSVMLVGGLRSSAVNAATIKISSRSITLIKGQSKTLKVSGTKKKVTWTTNKKSVAVVSSKGKVTAKKKGTATITAKVAGKKLKCKVTVEQPRLSKSYIVLTTGGTRQLSLKGTSQKVKWSTKKSSIATVTSKGLVKGVKAGETTITATVSGKKYSCDVKVISLEKNYEKLKSYILKKGKVDDNGDSYIQYRMQQEDVEEDELELIKITYVTDSDQYKFEYYIETREKEDEARISCVMYVNVLNSTTADVNVELYDNTEGTITGKAKFNAAKWDLMDELTDKFIVTSTNSKYKTKELQEECDYYFTMAALVWDSYLDSKVNMGLEDLGLLRFLEE